MVGKQSKKWQVKPLRIIVTKTMGESFLLGAVKQI